MSCHVIPQDVGVRELQLEKQNLSEYAPHPSGPMISQEGEDKDLL